MSFVSHLDPKGGFSALMSCTDELSFGMRAGFPVVSKDIGATQPARFGCDIYE